ncbi:hypothetical protein SPOG_01149 [Schizosaccharomyces cryophilus OY26]|uniref:RRM domain-containing protein n=1 Tax=Schizosaccharomyces cryophilus (strain OY26 / ATCC MYA-4695 / CBS 11777 / NBRC 106824 / NRRL Y48691) TaxID=653667 RepID=S9X9I6_SCHCR|nr:uncharacterized protein SPOG_01149 [Schizosaccharomyces cryophilus OY26]EPY50391.1 hypothetical protein SPOG_01149 [Schizosaccharomyces cryophilus OY26]
MQQSSQPISVPANIRINRPTDGPIFSPMTYCNSYMPPVPTSIPMGIMQSHMKPMNVSFAQMPYPIPFNVLCQNGSCEQASTLANFRMDITQRPPHPQPATENDRNNGNDFTNFQVLPYGYWDYRAVLIHNMPSLYNVSEFLHLARFGTLERVVPIHERNQLFLAFLSAADALDFYNTVRYTDFTFKKQRLIVSTIDPMPLEPSIIEACHRGFVSRNVQISGSPFDFDEAALIQLLCSLGKAELISVCTKTGSIYIHYLSIADALYCIDFLASHPYYKNLNCCCFYERCDRYYATDFQVEKTVAGSNFTKPKVESIIHNSNDSSTETHANTFPKKSPVKKSITKLEQKEIPANPPCLSENGVLDKVPANEIIYKGKNRKFVDTTKEKSVRISEPEVIPLEDHTSPNKKSEQSSLISINSFQKNPNTSCTKTNVSNSVLECHSNIPALQNVTNTSSSACHPPKPRLTESSNECASPTISPNSDVDASSSLRLPSGSEYPEDDTAIIYPSSNDLNVINSTIHDQAYDSLSPNSKLDAVIDHEAKDKAISDKDKDLPQGSNVTSNYFSSSKETFFNANDYSDNDSTPVTKKALPSVSSTSIDTDTQTKTCPKTEVTEKTPSTCESFSNTSSIGSLPPQHTDENPINDFMNLPKLTTELSSSRSSSALTSPTLVGSPLEISAKAFTDLSELIEMDIISKPSNDICLVSDLDPCSKNRTLFLSNIHKATKQFEISKLFKGFPLEEIHYISKKKICFVTFLESYDAKIFLQARQKQPPYLHGRPVKLEWAKSNNPYTDQLLYAIANGVSRSISFEMIHPSITRSELASVFKIFGAVESFHFSKPKSAGSIIYNSIYAAMKAMEYFQSHPTFKKAIFNYSYDDRYDLQNVADENQFCLKGNKSICLFKEASFQESPKLPSRFHNHDSYSPFRSKSTNLRPPECAIISANA